MARPSCTHARWRARSFAGLLAALCVAPPPGVRAQLNMTVWSNTALGPAAAGSSALVPAVNFSSAAGGAAAPLADYSSARFDGTVCSPFTQYVYFSIVTSGAVRLWIDDHLVIDGSGYGAANATSPPRVANASAILNVPMAAGAPVPIRLEYTQYAGPAVLQLYWQANFTALQVVPPSALAPNVSAAEVQRQALRDRLYAPPVQWQTYYNPSMGTHVHMPDGFAVDLTIADTRTEEVLGPIFVFRQSSPAIVWVGLHSANGSDFSQVLVFAWGQRQCNVTLESTVAVVAAAGGAAAGRQDLQLVVSSVGADCNHMVLLVQPLWLWGHAGTANASGPGVFTAYAPGFPDITVYSASGPGGSFPNVTTGFVLPLSSTGGAVGVSTGAPYSVAAMQANVAAAAAAAAAALNQYGELADLYGVIQTIIWWNTIYTPYEGVITPVSRSWDFGSGCE
jgi:hypothetical protein